MRCGWSMRLRARGCRRQRQRLPRHYPARRPRQLPLRRRRRQCRRHRKRRRRPESDAMNLKPRRPEEPEINVVSLIDVVLLLVVFFMLSSNFSAEGRLRIRLPQAGSVPVERNGGQGLVVTVSASGAYLVNGRELINSGADTLRAAI